ncbi:thiamine-phosphate pyrophosphorylase domain protein [Clostridioides difficile DA00165]|nr:thiamine-phosphate pyrophosphorylase domain protein [Clostridioides difficile DA00165]
MPFVLIGGINLDNIDKLKCLESDGYAIISAILKAEDISKSGKVDIKNIKLALE